jgi:hypothetical protein
MRRTVAIASAVVVILVLAVAGLTVWGQQPHQQPDHNQFCFAEWCIAPTAVTHTRSTTAVDVEVRSQAISATQRPDHPQAWLVDQHGRLIGGPQARLNEAIEPEQDYSTELVFPLVTARCATFLVSEGAWPSFLGLGYAPSPFTERARWQLCS